MDVGTLEQCTGRHKKVDALHFGHIFGFPQKTEP